MNLAPKMHYTAHLDLGHLQMPEWCRTELIAILDRLKAESEAQFGTSRVELQIVGETACHKIGFLERLCQTPAADPPIKIQIPAGVLFQASWLPIDSDADDDLPKPVYSAVK